MYTILVIDDNPTIRKVLTNILKTEKYKVLTSVHAAEGVTAAVRERPDLILLDVVLPDENGIDVCARLKSMPETKHIPVILMTGEAIDVDNKIEGIEGGAEDYITKPFMPEEVLARVKGILKRNFNIK